MKYISIKLRNIEKKRLLRKCYSCSAPWIRFSSLCLSVWQFLHASSHMLNFRQQHSSSEANQVSRLFWEKELFTCTHPFRLPVIFSLCSAKQWRIEQKKNAYIHFAKPNQNQFAKSMPSMSLDMCSDGSALDGVVTSLGHHARRRII